MGAQIEVKDKLSRTRLHFAGNAEVAKCLIKSSTQIEAKDQDGCTPLHTSVNKKKFDVAQLLIQMGAGMDSKNTKGNTSLHIAAVKGHLEIVKYLIQEGAKVDIRNNGNMIPFDVADKNEQYEVAKYLLEKKKESELKNPPNNVSVQALCIICLTPRNGLYILHPCNHVSLCEPCCYKLKRERYFKCPSCRKPIKNYEKIFFQEAESK